MHNHHNFAWKEDHNGKENIVVRKGATPSAPVLHVLKPIGVCMAGADEFDPYKD